MMLSKLKQMIPERFKGPLIAAFMPVEDHQLKAWKGKKKVVLALAGFYQNMGDMALTYAQKRFIEETLPGYDVLLFPSSHTYSRMKALKEVVGPEDIITIIGGGNMDDLYPSLENARRFIVRSFPNNPIISFPQTISFTKTKNGERALKRSARTYNKHANLTVFAREPESFVSMEAAFYRAKIACTPDSVLSLSVSDEAQHRAGVMVSIRSDMESVLSATEKTKIHAFLEKSMHKVMYRDTVDIGIEDAQPGTYEKTLNDFWSLMGSQKLVVTDRLHAMIFCVLTRTPVIVLSNSNHKIRGTYEAWLKNHRFVKYFDEFDEAEFNKSVVRLLALNSEEIHRPDLAIKFQPLRDSLIQASQV